MSENSFKRTLMMASLAAFVLLMTACEPGPGQLQTGSEACSYCSMHISEPEYASQWVSKQGRSTFFDSIECLAAAVLEQGEDMDQLHSIWVADFSGGQDWLPIEEAHFLQSDGLKSPMSLSLTAWASRDEAESGQQQFGGQLLRWGDVLEYVRESWSDQIEH